MSAITDELLYKVTLKDGAELIGVSLTKLRQLQDQGRISSGSTVQESPESSPCPATEYIELWTSQHLSVEPTQATPRIRLASLLFYAGSLSLVLPVFLADSYAHAAWTIWIAPLWMTTLATALMFKRYPTRLRIQTASLYLLPLIELVLPARDPSITALVALTAAITCGFILVWPARPRRGVDLSIFGAGLSFFALFFLF